MKKQILILCMALFVAAFCSSCDKNGGYQTTGPEEEGGKLTISFGFDQGPSTMAAQSTAKPTTSWSQNIKDLLILFVKANNTVADARSIVVPTGNDIADKTFAFTNLVANKAGESYTIYLVANSQQVAAIQAHQGWNASNCKGKNINDLLMKLVVNPAFTVITGSSEVGSQGYLEPAEIFLAKRTNVVINADANTDLSTTPFRLTRAISLLRVRIDQSKNGNNTVQFNQADASFRIRRASNNLKIDGTYTRGNEKSLIYLKGAFLTADPTTGYNTGTIINGNFKLWKDIKMFPGGSMTTGTQKFDVVLIGKAPVGYVPLGKTTGLTAAADVAWSGAVNEVVDANGILEINLTLESPGKWIDDPDEPGVPEPGQYGSVNITVNLVEWGTIKAIDIPL